MSSEIVYMTGQEMSQAITGYGQAVSGMTAAEAAAVLGASSYGTQGGAAIVSFPMQYVKGGGTVSLEAAYAAQMWEYWKISGAAAGTTALGAAAAAAKSWASGVLFGDAELAGTLAGTGGLLTMSLPAVAAAAAPILGVSIGSVLYESNPELWEKISRALLPWAYDDKNTIAAVVDELGQVFIPKDLINALKQLFEDEGIGQSDTRTFNTTYDGGNISGNCFSVVLTTTGYTPCPDGYSYKLEKSSSGPDFSVEFRFGSARGGSWLYNVASCPASSWPGSYGLSRSDGAGITQLSYPGYKYFGPVFTDPTFTISGISSGSLMYYIARAMWEAPSQAAGGYPTGTSEWTGNSVDLDSTATKGVITNPQAGTIQQYFPITLSTGDPTTTIDPETQPDPTAPVELPQLDPYIAPVTPPEMWPEFSEEVPLPTPEEQTAPQTDTDPIYIPAPNLDPDADPSLAPDQEPADELPTEQSPLSGGVTPPITFPIPEIQWPSIIPSSGSGLIHVYNPTPSEFIAFGHWLWVTYADPSIDKLWNNPFDGVIGAHELYATPSQGGTDTIKSGFLDSGISSTLVRVRYTSINCGSMVIPEYWGNYLDYSPYSKAFIYLPFIGIVEVDVDDIVGHAINILYHIDSYNGSCIAQITVAKDNYVNTLYQFSGNCAVDLPLAGGSQSAIRAGLISAAAYGIGSTVNGIINGAAYGSLGGGLGAGLGALVGGVTGAVSGAANGAANVVSQKSTVQHSGSFGASYGAMGIKKPYIIIRRPIQKQVNGYQHDYGFPAHKRVIIGSCTGFLRVREVNVQSTLATDEEKVMIENLLKTGVYVNG